MESEDALGLIDFDELRRTRSLLRYDARGHGGSGSTEGGYHWRDLALDQLAVADSVGVGIYVAGGASMGCATALHAAVLAPARIAALVLMIPPTAWETRAAQAGAYLTMADLVEREEHAELIELAGRRPAPEPLADEPRWTERFPELLATTDPIRLARIFRGAATADLPTRDEIATIDVPALVLAWTGDPGHPVSTAEALADLLPDVELEVARTRPELDTWTATIARFLERVDASSTTLLP